MIIKWIYKWLNGAAKNYGAHRTAKNYGAHHAACIVMYGKPYCCKTKFVYSEKTHYTEYITK